MIKAKQSPVGWIYKHGANVNTIDKLRAYPIVPVVNLQFRKCIRQAAGVEGLSAGAL